MSRMVSPLWFSKKQVAAAATLYQADAHSRCSMSPRKEREINIFFILYQAYSLMKSCWAYNFEERPCFSILGNQIESIMQDERDNPHGWWGSPLQGKAARDHERDFLLRLQFKGSFHRDNSKQQTTSALKGPHKYTIPKELRCSFYVWIPEIWYVKETDVKHVIHYIHLLGYSAVQECCSMSKRLKHTVLLLLFVAETCTVGNLPDTPDRYLLQ